MSSPLSQEFTTNQWITKHLNKTREKPLPPAHDRSHCWYFLPVSILDPLIMLCCEYSNFHLSYPFFTPFEPWQNQMDLLRHQVRKLELVPTQKASVMSLQVISGLGHRSLNTKIGNRAHLRPLGNLQHTGKPLKLQKQKRTTWALYSVACHWQSDNHDIHFLLIPFKFCSPPVHLGVAERIRGDRGIFWILRVVHGHYSNSVK